jgi:long-chain acyl-CoA synthetase
MNFLIAAFSCPVLQAYGSTEVAGGICTTSATDYKAGVVGGPLPSIKIKLVDAPELGFSTSDP